MIYWMNFAGAVLAKNICNQVESIARGMMNTILGGE